MTSPSRSARVWVWVFVGLLLGTLTLVVLAPFVQDPLVRGVYPQVGVATLSVVVLVMAVVWAIRPVRVHAATWTAWLAAGVTVALPLGPISLWYLGREGLGYQVFQALGVGTSPYGFGDMDVVLSWLDCARAGVDPYGADAVTCAVGPSNYGPAVFWLVPLGVSRTAAPLFGALGVALSALAIFWLVRQSRGWGRLTLVAVSASAAWVLVQERANLDAAIVWAAVLLVFLARRYQGLWPWILASIPIWILGAWKYYPFALVIALIPVVRLKHGWAVIAGFIGLAAVYLVTMRDYVLLSLSSNANLSSGEFGGFGRDLAAAFVAGEARSSTSWAWGDFVIASVMFAAFGWGWAVVGKIHAQPSRLRLSRIPLTAESMLAICGATGVIIAVGLGGFGYNYKATLMFLGVPLLARLADQRTTLEFRAGLLMLAFVLVSAFVVTNVLLASICVLSVAAFLTGASLRPLLAWIRTQGQELS